MNHLLIFITLIISMGAVAFELHKTNFEFFFSHMHSNIFTYNHMLTLAFRVLVLAKGLFKSDDGN